MFQKAQLSACVPFSLSVCHKKSLFPIANGITILIGVKSRVLLRLRRLSGYSRALLILIIFRLMDCPLNNCPFRFKVISLNSEDVISTTYFKDSMNSSIEQLLL